MSTVRRKIVLLGSTGTIGRLTLDVVDRLKDRFEVVGLAGWSNDSLLAEQTLHLRPERIAIGRSEVVPALRERLGSRWSGEIMTGIDGIVELAGSGVDLVVNGLVGSSGLRPSLAALRAGATLALANKESLVVAGELLQKTAREGDSKILPIDSEHSGLFQCLEGHAMEGVERVILTASGGPFRRWPLEEIPDAQPAQALRHPTWKMGPRITIDSATLLNKGFEILEARWLFDIDPDRIDVLIHPQSLIHAIVEFHDRSMLAQVSATDMRLPIQYALCYPERPATDLPRCDLTAAGELGFEEVDPARYPCLALARTSAKMGGTAPAILNAADEVLVEAFLAERIRFGEIAPLLSRVLDEVEPEPAQDLAAIQRADRLGRERAKALTEPA